MTREEAALKLSEHLMHCCALMPIEWVEQTGTSSETREAFQMAIAALRYGGPKYVLLSTPPADAQTIDTGIDALREQETVTNRNGLTNADHIRAMDDEELADYMSEHSIDDFCYIICGGKCKAVATFNKTSGQRCREIVSNWLKQPYKENQ